MPVKFEEERCKGCGLCIQACPRGLISLNHGRVNTSGFYPAMLSDIEKCTSCGLCALMCPDTAIVVYE